MSEGVQAALGKVKEASKANDEAIDFAKSSEAENFGRVVANTVSLCK